MAGASLGHVKEGQDENLVDIHVHVHDEGTSRFPEYDWNSVPKDLLATRLRTVSTDPAPRKSSTPSSLHRSTPWSR
jgi:hypothetical protein